MSHKVKSFVYLAICAGYFCTAILVSSAPAAPMPLNPATTPSGASLSVRYNPSSGNVAVHPPEGVMLTALELRSASSSFIPNCTGLDGMFDVCQPEKVFKMSVDGFDSLDFGQILPTGWTLDQFVSDLQVNGATLPSGFETGSGIYGVIVPEPTGAAHLLAVGLLAMLRRRRPR
jgi:hypothetical protein